MSHIENLDSFSKPGEKFADLATSSNILTKNL